MFSTVLGGMKLGFGDYGRLTKVLRVRIGNRVGGLVIGACLGSFGGLGIAWCRRVGCKQKTLAVMLAMWKAKATRTATSHKSQKTAAKAKKHPPTDDSTDQPTNREPLQDPARQT